MKLAAKYEEACEREWEEICDRIAALGPWGKELSDRLLRRLTINAPVTLGFCVLCVLVHLLTLNGSFLALTKGLAVMHRLNLLSPLQYTSFFTHILAHENYGHLRGNMTNLLLIGPSVEHHFGSSNLLWIIAVVSVVSAVAHILIGRSNSYQLGASGVVFAFILLSSMVSAKKGQIPVAFVLTVILYLGEELWLLIVPSDQVSHHAHLTGGLVGAIAGFYIHDQEANEGTNQKQVQTKNWLSFGQKAGRTKKNK